MEDALSHLRSIFAKEGNELPKLLNFFLTKWGDDVYSQGSYSYVAIDATGEDYDVLAQPVDNKLFFAGMGKFNLRAICQQVVCLRKMCYR